MNKESKFKIGIICGGPSLERGISLNSARSVMDHLVSEYTEIIPFYFDLKKRAYQISKAQLYSNNPSDFDFKLKQTALPLKPQALTRALKNMDLVFPIIHGAFGEDGGIQNFLEKNDIPFIGSSAQACKKAFDKFTASQEIQKKGFFTLPALLVKRGERNLQKKLSEFFKKNHIKRAVVKPARGGSSLNVFSVLTVKAAFEKVNFIFAETKELRIIVEPFATGTEFTIILLENQAGQPVALPPTEIETDYKKDQFFDFRKKYLSTGQVRFHCPPQRLNTLLIGKIQQQAEALFILFGLRDVARFDGWVLPNGNIWFCDFNLISGMEQNSFLFQQAAHIGMTHREVLHYLVKNACFRYGIAFKERSRRNPLRQVIPILMGGRTSERQVSLMSGTNIWLKLRQSSHYEPQPYLLDSEGRVWLLPYNFCLNHTVEEITENCKHYTQLEKRLSGFEKQARLRLGLSAEKNIKEFFNPKKMSLTQFINQASDFIFIALHGGVGENGTLQRRLEKKHIAFNGPESRLARLCADKWSTGRFIEKMKISNINRIPGCLFTIPYLFKAYPFKLTSVWKAITEHLHTQKIIVKPTADGCSTGILLLQSSDMLKKYIRFMLNKLKFIPKSTFPGQNNIIEMPSVLPSALMFEPFIETDTLYIQNNQLKYEYKTGWIEMTIGVLERKGKIKALNPSITVAEGNVLAIEEKFQGGTGINITPPPSRLMKSKLLEKVKDSITHLAEKMGLRGYSRFDVFTHLKTGQLLIIEINTLPGLTASTVLYHQGLAESPPLFPRELIEILIENKKVHQ